jgi:hypothetical protein
LSDRPHRDLDSWPTLISSDEGEDVTTFDARAHDLQLLRTMVARRDFEVVALAIRAHFDELGYSSQTKLVSPPVANPPARNNDLKGLSERALSAISFEPCELETRKRKCENSEEEGRKKFRAGPFSRHMDLYDTSRPMQRRKRAPRPRRVLPMKFTCGTSTSTTLEILACPDSGSMDNIMSFSVAEKLGCRVQEPSRESRETFNLANGKSVVSLGKAVASCAFSTGAAWDGPDAGPANDLECVFQVFQTLSVPMIMGMGFLEETQTLSKFTDRLIGEPFSTRRPIMVNSVGTPAKSLVCQLDGFTALASIDTGADLDFVSESYAESRGFHKREARYNVMFADGSMGLTSGVIQVRLVVGLVDVDEQNFAPRSESIVLDFHILPNLTQDVLIGHETIQELNVFQDHLSSIISTRLGEGLPVINIIRLMGGRESDLSKFRKRLTGIGFDSGRLSLPLSCEITASAMLTSGIDKNVEFEDELESQRQNARAEMAQSDGKYACTFGDCAVPPFETQGLLDR